MVFWRKKKKAEDQDKQNEQEQDKQVQPEQAAPVPESVPEEAEPESVAPLEPEAKETATPPVQPVEQVAEPVKNVEAAEPVEPLAEAQGSWLSRLGSGLSKSSNKLTQGLTDLVTKKKLDQDMLDELEDLLITADLGPKTAAKLVEEFGRERFGKDISEDEIKEALAAQITEILTPVAKPLEYPAPLSVVLVCGVNGVGKTTTIGKIAYELNVQESMPVMIAAGDTFRAAAIEQLEIWAQRAKCKLVRKDLGADAAAVAYEAYDQAKREGAKVLFIDTAGRLHNKSNLMAELEKIVRVLKKQDEALPHSTLLVLDATTGQNAVEQVRIFKEMVNITGLVVTKLDGSAKGGIVVSLADQFGLPIHMVGVGEQIGDLQPFNAGDFAKSLVGLK